MVLVYDCHFDMSPVTIQILKIIYTIYHLSCGNVTAEGQHGWCSWQGLNQRPLGPKSKAQPLHQSSPLNQKIIWITCCFECFHALTFAGFIIIIFSIKLLLSEQNILALCEVVWAQGCSINSWLTLSWLNAAALCAGNFTHCKNILFWLNMLVSDQFW